MYRGGQRISRAGDAAAIAGSPANETGFVKLQRQRALIAIGTRSGLSFWLISTSISEGQWNNRSCCHVPFVVLQRGNEHLSPLCVGAVYSLARVSRSEEHTSE